MQRALLAKKLYACCKKHYFLKNYALPKKRYLLKNCMLYAKSVTCSKTVCLLQKALLS